MARELICHNHDSIIRGLTKILGKIYQGLRYSSDNAEELCLMLQDIEWEVGNAIDEAEIAKKSGQAMEDRLSEYKSAIEDLGFVRNDKSKILK